VYVFATALRLLPGAPVPRKRTLTSASRHLCRSGGCRCAPTFVSRLRPARGCARRCGWRSVLVALPLWWSPASQVLRVLSAAAPRPLVSLCIRLSRARARSLCRPLVSLCIRLSVIPKMLKTRTSLCSVHLSSSLPHTFLSPTLPPSPSRPPTPPPSPPHHPIPCPPHFACLRPARWAVLGVTFPC